MNREIEECKDRPFLQITFDNWQKGSSHLLNLILEDETIEVKSVITEYGAGKADNKAVILECNIRKQP